ncbi:ribosome small subunit-dependent GTPase A [Clostridiisalibacter paucivorans]|uniref:ribosome small subunit-dependent GTPase A n=1 Tax=Clostridiisalibacter paucivorans TaxID=408753 RepID=UPI00047E183C|nr:ribosome small subunit-dependent GTPase A [Clostridiisalibacter paucivorans]
MLEGIIVKGIGGFYYVKVNNDVYECRARGLFRKKSVKPLVGDKVKIEVTDEDKKIGYVMELFDRETELIRPPVANVNQAVIVFSIKQPDPNLWLLDRFLILAESQDLDIYICINKIDLASVEELEKINTIYSNAGYKVINTTVKKGLGIDELKSVLKDKITVFAGPSGVGKSTLLNNIQKGLNLKVGDISKKTNRGKHTTRWAELLELDMGGWVVDTAGFSSLDLSFIQEEDLELYFKEIYEKSHLCRFNGCKHYKEPDCAIKNSLEDGEISKTRYDSYINFLQEIKNNRRY